MIKKGPDGHLIFDLDKNEDQLWNLLFLRQYVFDLWDDRLKVNERCTDRVEKQRVNNKIQSQKAPFENEKELDKIDIVSNNYTLNEDAVKSLKQSVLAFFKLRNSLSHKNNYFRFDENYFYIDNKKGKFDIMIPKDYISNFLVNKTVIHVSNLKTFIGANKEYEHISSHRKKIINIFKDYRDVIFMPSPQQYQAYFAYNRKYEETQRQIRTLLLSNPINRILYIKNMTNMFKTNNIKSVPLIVYMYSVFSKFDVRIIDEINDPHAPLYFVRDKLEHIRNAVCHFRYEPVMQNGKMSENQIKLFDEDDMGNNRVELIFDIQQLYDITHNVELLIDEKKLESDLMTL